jgi:hypothetical protein
VSRHQEAAVAADAAALALLLLVQDVCSQAHGTCARCARCRG